MSKEKFDIVAWLRGSLDNTKDGASSKKMAAFWVVMVLVTPIIIVWLVKAYKTNDWKLLPEILDSLLIFAAATLGINGAEKVVERFTTKKTPINETDATKSSTDN